MAELNWSDAQWQMVKDAVTDGFNTASVANSFLPICGPVAGSTEVVRNERLFLEDLSNTIRLDADHPAVNLKLVNLTVKVELSSEQIADETLSNALLAFRRAANILAQQQDRIVFSGFLREKDPEGSVFVANKPGVQKGLADPDVRSRFKPIPTGVDDKVGQLIVPKVVEAIGALESSSNPGPFACVLGDFLYNCAYTPAKESLVLPADRITPQLKGGQLFRCGQMDKDTGVVISLAGRAVDIVVGTPPMPQFLQRKEDAKYLFRVYERFVLRIRDKDKLPVAGFKVARRGK